MRSLTLMLSMAVIISVAAAQTSEFLVDTCGVHREAFPAVGFDGTNFLVVWTDYRGGDSSDLYGTRVSSQGEIIDPAGFIISAAVRSQDQPAVLFGNTNYLVVWRDYRSGGYTDIYGARVTTDGLVLDSTGFVVSQAALSQSSPALAYDGTNYLVVWGDNRRGTLTDYYDIYGARVSPSGVVLDPSGFRISQMLNYQDHPAVAYGETNFLVVWHESWYVHSGDRHAIYGSRVTTDGAVLDTTSIIVSQGGRMQDEPALAFDGVYYLVVWQYSPVYTWDIYGSLVTSEGASSLPFMVSDGQNDQRSPSVVFDGSDYRIAWWDNRSGGSSDIYGARVTYPRTVCDEQPLAVQEGDQQYPTLCCGSDGLVFLVYQGFAGEVGGKIYNTDRVWGKLGPYIGISEEPSPVKLPAMSSSVLRSATWRDGEGWPRTGTTELIDISGRMVTDLASDVQNSERLAPGVYFVRSGAQAVRKVIITR